MKDSEAADLKLKLFSSSQHYYAESIFIVCFKEKIKHEYSYIRY